MGVLRWPWALPVRALGLAVALLWRALGWQIECQRGALARVIVSRGPFPRWLRRGKRKWSAFTIGTTVLCWRTPDPALIAHELEHVRQWRQWGVLFPLAYLCELAANGYDGSAFEQAAREAARRLG